MAIETVRLDATMGTLLCNQGALTQAPAVVVGDKLGLYKVLAGRSLTAGQLAAVTETDARYVHEWLSTQAASGHLDYEPATDRFGVSAKQAKALSLEGGPLQRDPALHNLSSP